MRELDKISDKERIRLVITGASGFVASEIIPHLEQHVELLLVSRDEQALAAKYPQHSVSSYQKLEQNAKGADALLHLAIINSNQDVTLEAAREVNVRLLQEVVETAIRAGIKRFVYTSTTHGLNTHSKTPYAITKREVEEWLSEISDIQVTVLRLPAVHGLRFAGRWSILNSFPELLRKPTAKFLAALIPVVSAKKVSNAILAACNSETDKQAVISERQSGNWVYGILKRILDLGFAISVVLLFWWLLIAIWMLVKLTTPGPGLFAQSRVGRNQREFVCLKFRTMYLGTSQSGTHNIDAGAITPVGRVLRKTKLDELPQVWNILKNELSLVGPRPCLLVQQELIELRSRADIFSIKPGITGLAQVQGIDMADPAELTQWDRRYLDLQSLLLDIKIVIRTALGGGQGDKVRKP